MKVNRVRTGIGSVLFIFFPKQDSKSKFLKKDKIIPFVSSVVLLTCFGCFKRIQELPQKVYYKGIELKLPNNWNHKSQEIKTDSVFQITCWEKGNTNSFAVQKIETEMDLAAYVNFLNQIFKELPILKNASLANFKYGAFQGNKSIECTFSGSILEFNYGGKIIGFNRQGKAYWIVYSGNESFLKGSLLQKILSSIKIDSIENKISNIPSQPIVIPEKWTKIEIKDIGSIAIPPSMELRDDNSFISLVADISYDHFNTYQKIKMTKPKIVIQPKGLNEVNRLPFPTYSRILIYVAKGKPGDFPKINEKLNFSASEMKVIEDYLKEEAEAQLGKLFGKVLKWYPVEILSINGMTTIKISYLRQGINTPVFVQVYKFFNYDEAIEITLSYRENESELWKSDFDKVINTFDITNKKQ
uniref:Uncharacterized protein n=1 Tax=candidate division WOR-3 bacterium TaxID=2052148 RepID=A0A7C6AAE0_UNCW3